MYRSADPAKRPLNSPHCCFAGRSPARSQFQVAAPPDAKAGAGMMLTAILTARTMLIKRFFICKVLLESKIFPVCYRQIIVFILTLLNGHCNRLQRSNAMYFHTRPVSLFSIFVQSCSCASQRNRLQESLTKAVWPRRAALPFLFYIENPNLLATKIIVPHRLIQRESCCPPPEI